MDTEIGPQVANTFTMTKNQFNAALERLGLTQSEAADYLGVSLRSINGYANGAKISKTVAKLLDMYLRHGLPK
jgi:DNA-binding XRE family transcriptional regulator